MQLPIDECEEWISDAIKCTKDCGFEYIKDGNKEFLIFNTNDFFADAKALAKIRKTTGMELVQMVPAWIYTVVVWYHLLQKESSILISINALYLSIDSGIMVIIRYISLPAI